MRKLFALLFFAGVTLCMTSTANAQALRVDVPFDFVVGGKTLPAATYTIRESLPNDNTGLAFIGDKQGVLARAIDIDDHFTGTKLVFRRVDGEYFLRDVVTLRGTLHFATSKKDSQRALAADEQLITIAAGY
ncbi:MAG TPA: hypothetical protein VNX88_02995 [Terriglobales bacterium]|jgi:hypothetical protein|nr:hypothetical protein [Terriglobales bacterium]